ncbi:MAG: SDR family oxidoreductase [Candidatus Eremiobacteraeota bacterium]|nr:SDR family oxidoreductase [Candidatus Eremiobacteraeota bacterium]
MARHLARLGARIVVSDIDIEGAECTRDQIAADGGSSIVVPANVEIEDDVIKLVNAAIDAFGGIDVLVNSAGPYYPGEALPRWRSTIAANLMGAIYGTMHVIEPMRKRGGGAIIYYGSTSAIGHGRKHSGDAFYDVAKAAVTRMATGLSYMLENYGIRTNCIAPDWVATDEVQEYWQTLTPAERARDGIPDALTSLDDISRVVTRLITDEDLSGRVVVWWSEERPGIIPRGDSGYGVLEPFEF